MIKKLTELSMKKRVAIKVLAVLLVMTLTYANILVLGKYLGEGLISYAKESSVNNQDSNTSIDNVKFELYLNPNNKAEKTIEKDINSTDLVLYANIKVENGGVLKNGKISFENTNFKLKNEADSQKLILNTILSGQEVLVELPIVASKDEAEFNLGLLDMVNTVKLTGKYTDNDGEVVDVNADKNVQITWSGLNITEENNPGLLTQEVITNKTYEINGEAKRVVQVSVKSGIANNIYPIKETNIEIDIPVVNEEQTVPEAIKVSAINGTAATNNIVEMVEVEDISVENEAPNIWNFEVENNKINIKSRNIPNNNNIISWAKSGVDEFIVTYVYKEEVTIDSFVSNVKNSIFLYDVNNTVINKESEIKEEEIEEKSNITTSEILSTKETYKSNLSIGDDISYITKWSIGVNYAPAIDSVSVASGKDIIYNQKETNEYDRSIYQEMYISKDKIIELFGEQGIIEVYNNETNELLYTINGETEAGEGSTIINTFTNNVSDISIKTSKPIKEGKLDIYVRKAVKSGLKPEEISDIYVLKTKSVLLGINSDNEIEEKTKEADMKFNNPVTVSKLRNRQNKFIYCTTK